MTGFIKISPCPSFPKRGNCLPLEKGPACRQAGVRRDFLMFEITPFV